MDIFEGRLSQAQRLVLPGIQAELADAFSVWRKTSLEGGSQRCRVLRVFFSRVARIAGVDVDLCPPTPSQAKDLSRLALRELGARWDLNIDHWASDVASRAALEIRDADVMRFAMSRYPEAMAWGTKLLSKVADCRLSSPDVFKVYRDWHAFDQT